MIDAVAGLIAAGGASLAFDAVFGVFVAAFVVLAAVTLRWAVRRDRAGRAEWARRRAAAEQGGSVDDAASNGHTAARASRQAGGAGAPARVAGRSRGRKGARGPRPRP
jgi:hypothetical protein